jgi:hypothetical protein
MNGGISMSNPYSFMTYRNNANLSNTANLENPADLGDISSLGNAGSMGENANIAGIEAKPDFSKCKAQYFNPMPITNIRLAHAYVPFQCLMCLYPPEMGLRQGTIFPELDAPYGMDPEYTLDT